MVDEGNHSQMAQPRAQNRRFVAELYGVVQDYLVGDERNMTGLFVQKYWEVHRPS